MRLQRGLSFVVQPEGVGHLSDRDWIAFGFCGDLIHSIRRTFHRTDFEACMTSSGTTADRSIKGTRCPDEPPAPLRYSWSALHRGHRRAHGGKTRFKRLTEHHFYILTSRHRHALFFDYGFASMDHVAGGCRFVEHSLAELRKGSMQLDGLASSSRRTACRETSPDVDPPRLSTHDRHRVTPPIERWQPSRRR